MTDETARTVANAALTTVTLVAAYYVLRQPRLRRVVFAGLRTALTTTLPAYLLNEIREAWVASGQHQPRV
jgi:hypothetical protein